MNILIEAGVTVLVLCDKEHCRWFDSPNGADSLQPCGAPWWQGLISYTGRPPYASIAGSTVEAMVDLATLWAAYPLYLLSCGEAICSNDHVHNADKAAS